MSRPRSTRLASPSLKARHHPCHEPAMRIAAHGQLTRAGMEVGPQLLLARPPS
eukprot:CAMPEP_0206154938 /NCGR_PEP_ID=MMETSP1474-20131121/1789_1 /ASSEMBLY_ACC=CAM_ASM_001110 /TAXON_ID=97495 /ORGANISM="Imantonia sp., Strain RCC918" /LENGTH=52 /DNA_ID=CAMNT_0053553423 /DNA_START=150 /DNA_END=308 /DNA_ORIENTATION=-